MKKFKFNLTSLQTVRGWNEQKARQELAAANDRVRSLQERIETLGAEREQAFASWNLDTNRRFSPRERLSVDAHVAHVEAAAIQVRKELAAAQEARGKAMDNLARASRELKVVENLRTKRLQEHEAEVASHEAAEIEDIFNARRSAQSSL